jgi:hypothetical protein
MITDLYLLRVEGQNFDWVIFDTHDLSTIAGGSRLLADAPERVEKLLAEIPGVQAVRKIQCAASIGFFAVAAYRTDFQLIMDAVKKELAKPHFCHLTVSVVAIEAGSVRLQHEKDKFVIPSTSMENIQTHFETSLLTGARWTQMRAPNVAVPNIVPAVTRACSVDRVRPAVGNDKSDKSPSVLERREVGKGFRWMRDGDEAEIPTVQTFEEMTECKGDKRRTGRLAVISIDGKGFTKLRSDLCRNLNELRSFSDQLVEQQKSFMSELLKVWTGNLSDPRYFQSYNPRPEDAKRRTAGPLFRFQRLVTAGDDAVYLMPAWLAWEFLTKFFEHQWKLTRPLAEGRTETRLLNFRAGVVICHAKAPIHPIRRLAHTLESEVAAEDGKSLENPVAYEVLKSFDFIGASLKEYREQKRACLQPREALLEGKEIARLKIRLQELQTKASSGEIKTPLRWLDTLKSLNDPKFQPGDLYHLSQWRDYIF